MSSGEKWTVVAILLGALAFVAGAGFVARLVLGPVSRHVGAIGTGRRFQLCDFLSLMILCQVAFALIGVIRDTFVGYYMFAYALTLCGTFLMWYGAVTFLHRAGVERAGHRMMFVLAVMPLTSALSIFLPGVPFIVFVNRVLEYDTGPWLWRGNEWLLWTVPLSLVVAWAVRQLSIQIVMARSPANIPSTDTTSTAPADDGGSHVSP